MKLSADEFEVQVNGPFWKEICEELDIWVEQLRSMLEDPDSAAELKDIHQLQGSLKAVRNMRNVANNLLETKRLEEEQEKRGEL